MTEATIQSGLQTIIQGLSAFADGDVVINEWGILDNPSLNAPFFLIENADAFDSRMDVPSDETTYRIPGNLIERFTDWKETLDNFLTRRDAILTAFNTAGTNRSGGGLEATDVMRIYNDGPITPIYDSYNVNQDEAMPIFIAQRMIFEVIEF